MRQKDANNERYQQQLMDMQKEMEARHRNDMAEMAKLHQQSMAEMRNAIANIRIPSGKSILVSSLTAGLRRFWFISVFRPEGRTYTFLFIKFVTRIVIGHDDQNCCILSIALCNEINDDVASLAKNRSCFDNVF